MKTMIVSAFPGCGKTYLYRNQEKFNYKILDSESTKFKKYDGWEKEYVDYIVSNIGRYDFIFVSKHPIVLQELNNRNIPFIMVSPDNSSNLFDKERQLIKQQWFGRFILRDNSHIKDFDKWIKRQIEHYDERTNYEHLTLYNPIKVILLKENEYLSDKIDKLYFEKEKHSVKNTNERGMTMNIKLRRVESKDDINLFVQYKVLLVKFHQQYANAIGLIDKVAEKYDENDAKKHIGEGNFYQFIIEYNDKDVGIIEYDIETSDIDNLKILFIKKLFIDSKYRKIGIGKTVLQKIKSETNLRIELECWYGMPANDLYKSLGMKELKTRYIF